MGPMPPPYMGQSIAFSTIVKSINGQCLVLNTAGKDHILSGLLLCLKILYYYIFYKIDVVYFTCSRTFLGSIRDVILLFGAKTKKIRTINHLHGADFKLFYDGLPTMYRKIVYWCYLGVDVHIVLLESMKKEFIDFPQAEIKVIANSYSKELDNLPLKKDRESDKIRFLYFSNIMKSKGILNLLQAFEYLLEKHQNIELNIAGVPMKDYLSSKEQIETNFTMIFDKIRKKYPERICYYGLCTGEQKKELLWDSDVFILPTFHFSEAFPISLLEAMRTGNYILTTNINYLLQIISTKNGNLIDRDSVNSIVDAVENIVFDKQLLRSIQNENIKYAKMNFSEDHYVFSVIDVIKNCDKSHI